VRQWFAQQDHDLHAARAVLLERELSKLGLPKSLTSTPWRAFQLRQRRRRLRRHRRGDLAVGWWHARLASPGRGRQGSEVKVKAPTVARPGRAEVIVEGVDDLLTHMAHCCKPVPPTHRRLHHPRAGSRPSCGLRQPARPAAGGARASHRCALGGAVPDAAYPWTYRSWRWTVRAAARRLLGDHQRRHRRDRCHHALGPRHRYGLHALHRGGARCRPTGAYPAQDRPIAWVIEVRRETDGLHRRPRRHRRWVRPPGCGVPQRRRHQCSRPPRPAPAGAPPAGQAVWGVKIRLGMSGASNGGRAGRLNREDIQAAHRWSRHAGPRPGLAVHQPAAGGVDQQAVGRIRPVPRPRRGYGVVARGSAGEDVDPCSSSAKGSGPPGRPPGRWRSGPPCRRPAPPEHGPAQLPVATMPRVLPASSKWGSRAGKTGDCWTGPGGHRRTVVQEARGMGQDQAKTCCTTAAVAYR